MVGDQHFYNGLPGHTESAGFFIEGLDHPEWEIHVDALLRMPDTTDFLKVQVASDILPLIEFLVKVSSFHISFSLQVAHVERK